MKKLTAAVAAFSLTLLAGCASSGGTPSTGAVIGTAVMQSMVDQKCRTELNNRQEWKLLSMAMTSQQKMNWETKICGCATEEAISNTTVVEMAQVANPSTRAQAVANITEKTVTACIKRFR